MNQSSHPVWGSLPSFPSPTAETYGIWGGAHVHRMTSQILTLSLTLLFPCPPSALCMWPFISIYSPLVPLLVIGLMIRPKTENLDVIVNVSDTESWDQHVQKLNKFLERECGTSDAAVQDLAQGTGDPESGPLGP